MNGKIRLLAGGLTGLALAICSPIILSPISSMALGQVDTAWVRYYDGGGESGFEPKALDVDSYGNVYVTGASGNDITTIKYDANGNLLWEQRYTNRAASPTTRENDHGDEEGHSAGHIVCARCVDAGLLGA